ncbi:MAG: hypothetical protein Q9182_002832 [Xanthomendoza sp. 2 TL-2023]
MGISEPERNAGPMLLALECLKKGVFKLENIDPAELGKMVAPSIRRCGEWFVPKAKPCLKGQSHLTATLRIAQDELDYLYPVGAELAGYRAGRNANSHQHCQMLWQLLSWYIELGGSDSSVRPKDIKIALTKLDKGKPAVKPPQLPSNLPRSRVGHRPEIGSNSVGLLANLSVSAEDRRAFLNRFDRLVGVAPRSGPLTSPVTLWSQNLETLTGTNWLDDHVIEAYLSLICHHGNGHFLLAAGGQETKVGSPKWHAWGIHVLEDEYGYSAIWPPPVYPAGKVEDVEHHFFPHHSVNHWVLLHLYRSRDTHWYADYYSSIKGNYDDLLDSLWAKVSTKMMEISQGGFDLSTARVQIPTTQPFQDNSNDCGVLALMVARCLLEGWKLESILAKHCPKYRDRMIVELEKWSLD